jgi:hypothetical protein
MTLLKAMHSKEDHFLDYKRALELLHVFVAYVESRPDLARFFVLHDINLLQTYSHNIFVDIRDWTSSPKAPLIAPTHSLVNLIKIAVIGLCMIGVTVVAWLVAIIKKKRILLYSIDKVSGEFQNDFRLDSLYGALHEAHVSYVELLHTVPGSSMLRHLWVRRRLVMYLEAFDWITLPFVLRIKRQIKPMLPSHIDELSQQEVQLFSFLIEKYVSMTVMSKLRCKIFRGLFKWNGFKALYAIDDVRHYGEIMYALKTLHVPSVGIQHGHFTKYHVGWLKIAKNFSTGKPDTLVVWSGYWKAELLRLDPLFASDDIVIGGAPSLNSPVAVEDDDVVTVLVPFETDADTLMVGECIRVLLSDPRFRVIFKVRSDMSVENQLKKYSLQEHPRLSVRTKIIEDIQSVDVVLGTYSTFLYEMIMLLRPVVLLETRLDYGEGMIKNDLAVSTAPSLLIETILEVSGTPKDVLLQRRKRLVDDEKLSLKAFLKQSIQSIMGYSTYKV